jgi:hypothetical protein
VSEDGALRIAACADRLSQSHESADFGGIQPEHVGSRLRAYRVGHDGNSPFNVLLRDCDQAVLVCHYFGSAGRRPVEPGDGALIASVERSKCALRLTHGFADGNRSPSRRGPGDHAT